jgi:hypothetical protein
MPPHPLPSPVPDRGAAAAAQRAAGARRLAALGALGAMPLPVPARPAEARLLLMAIRIWAARRRAGADPRCACAALVGPAARPLHTLLDSLAAAMGEPLCTMSARALAVTPDEALVLDLVEHAARSDCEGARRLLDGLVPGSAAVRLFGHAARLALLMPSG